MENDKAAELARDQAVADHRGVYEKNYTWTELLEDDEEFLVHIGDMMADREQEYFLQLQSALEDIEVDIFVARGIGMRAHRAAQSAMQGEANLGRWLYNSLHDYALRNGIIVEGGES